ncbi:lysine--tRNA ligase [Natrialba asiatica]|uniref:Lysine--tRNA ligase n=1 Tax=Natrialba asiatica (strain ATCC 700177 / DSM 12278 / JCM 9576 / FERM P-10747 / NBRC 102637 / 172P1) TaxID=29540 RepID=M0B4V6_NATA1|nr:lysine--tRNA ligase [Natrialba asiatica]ELZ04679.1 lysyl-tRNA ligase [Natrialba asiatica DSM 12278]
MSDDDAGRSPYTLQHEDDETRHAFWADTVADRVEERVADRDDDEKNPDVVIKGGISPSGVPHLGNVNEIMRGYFVAEVLRDRGYEVRQVFTADDRDPLRKLPRTLCNLDGELVDLGEVDAGALGRNLGHPYTDIPDPFGCCDSYGDHFSQIIRDSADAVDVPIDMVSTTDLYEDGEFDDVTRHVLENRDRAREILAEYQDKVNEDYVPFNPVCENCGKITETVTSVDVGSEERRSSDSQAEREASRETGDVTPTVDYRCTDLDAGDRTIEGCGHEGTATLREGKMPWRFEWPAQWQVLGVDFEPFGKDHAEGSWPSGDDVARNVLEIEPPVPMVYEWFTLDGEPFSSSEGNVILVSDVLELLEPEVLRYFFAKDPSRARDFSIERLDQLVDEFDRFEAIYFDEVEEATEDERAFAERVYPFVVEDPREERIRLPYTFAAVLGMTDDPDLREEIARREGHIPDDAPEWAVEDALARVERARNWARRTENEFDYELKRTAIPDHEFDAATEAALAELANFIEEGHGAEEIQGEIYETAKRHDVAVGEFFGAGYRLFFDEEQGPQLGPFLAKVDREFVVARLRRER